MRLQKPTRVTLRSTDVQRHFRDVVNRAGSGQEHIIVERDGLPVIVMISIAEYDALMREREARAKQFEDIARSIGAEYERLGLTEEDVLESLEESRQQLYDARHGKS